MPGPPGLASRTDEFVLKDSTGKDFRVRWLREPTIPTTRKAGTTGWALVDGCHPAVRVHVCADNPCQAMWPACVYGHLPMPRHGRLMSFATSKQPAGGVASETPTETAAAAPCAPAASETGTEPVAATRPATSQPASPATSAVAEGPEPPTAAAVGEVLGVADPAPPALPPFPPPALPPLPPPALPPPASPAPLPDAHIATSLATCIAEVADAPVPAPPAPSTGPIPPPGRAALIKGKFAAPLPPGETRGGGDLPSRKRSRGKQPAVAGATDYQEEEPVVVGELLNARVAGEINDFVAELLGKGRYVGVSAFLLLALARRMRIWVWHGTLRQEIVAAYAPWAVTFMTSDALFEVIACQSTGDGLCALDVGKETNHWVACVKAELAPVETRGGGDSAEGHDSSETQNTFHAIYIYVFIPCRRADNPGW